MKRYWYLFGLMSLAACSSWQREEAVAAYTFDTFRVESEQGCAADTMACAFFEVTYPVFDRLPESVQKQVRSAINDIITGEEATIDAAGKKFVDDFEQFNAEMPEYGIGWYYKAGVNVLTYTDSLLSMQVESEAFTGGAHGAHLVRYVNVDPKSGAPYELEDFLKVGYEDHLRAVAEEAFRKARDIAPDVSFEEAGFSFPDNRFALTDNFGFKPEGIVFFYNDYEVAAYAVGPTEILIPYEELAGWIK